MNTLTQTILEAGKQEAQTQLVNGVQTATVVATQHTATLWTNLTSINPLLAILLICLSIYIVYWAYKAIKFILTWICIAIGAGILLEILFHVVTK